MIRVFLDANGLFAAAQSHEGRSALLINFAEQGHCLCLTSPHAITEARRNLESRHPQALNKFEDVLSVVQPVQEATTSLYQWGT